ncbi:HD-GYP domain-containing protein [Flexivirga meconopsidis]|uniref:HD-GYP domain-containing protein n=1 Tax=Flexivirga meconopsidis TaxID=2977121 RepID=UPI00223F6F04|nr:HD domain-containing phosphohydrolase [Flexivirga meconopsidis]
MARFDARPGPSTMLLALGMVLCVAAAVLQDVLTTGRAWVVLVSFVIAIALASLLHLTSGGGEAWSPVASSVVLALALTGPQPTGALVPDTWMQVLGTAVVGLAAGAVLIRLTGDAWPHPSAFAGQLVALGVALLCYRELPLYSGESALHRYDEWAGERWRSAAAMALAGVLAGVVLLVSTMYRRREGQPIRQVLQRVDPMEAALIGAVVSTSVAIGLGMAPLGVLAIPLMSAPLILLRFALGQRVAVTETRRQTIAALSRLTDVAGYTAAGHSERVASLCLRIGRALQFSDQELSDLEDAARLHDIGQVSLRSRIPGGATVDIAPADQRGIADQGANIVRRTEVLDSVADIIEAQVVQFRQVQEYGEPVPVSSRIIKVCNAFEDLTGGDPGLRDAAIERMTLGIGYEYDPNVLDLLIRVTGRDRLVT